MSQDASSVKCKVYDPLSEMPDKLPPSVVLYGTIDSSESMPWRQRLVEKLGDLQIAVLNPFRADWDETWKEDGSCDKFTTQVRWELAQARRADVIAFHFGPDTFAPITLLEFGLNVATGKAIVYCAPGYAKRGNVVLVCDEYNVKPANTFDEFCQRIHDKLEELLKLQTDK